MNRLNFTIYLTTNCNMRCRYCYEKEYETKNMPMEVANSIICFIDKTISEKNADIVYIRFHGGEPLLAFSRMEFLINELDKIKKSKNVQFIYSATTNGTILENEMISTLKKLSELSVSIDGNKKNHDQNRIFINEQGSYEIVRENINRLLDIFPNIIGRVTITPNTYKEVFDNFLHIVDIGIKKIKLELDFMNQDWTEIMISEYVNELKRIADKIKKFKNSDIIIEVQLLEAAKLKTKNSNCEGGKTSFTITPDGKVYPCMFAINNKELLLGNLDSVLDEKVLNKIAEVAKLDNENCVGCTRYSYCKATRCKIVNYICTGDYCMPNPVMCVNENINVLIGKYFANIV